MSGKIPQPFIDDLLARTDIVDVIDGRVPLKKAGKEYKACCPFHQEKTPSFTVSQQKQFYHCFGCQANGSAIGFLMSYDHMSFVEAVEELAEMAGLEVPYEGGSKPFSDSAGQQRKDISDYDLLENITRFYRHQLKSHPEKETAIAYLKQRGLSGEVAKTFEIGFAPPGWSNLMPALGGEKIKEQLIATGMMIRKDNDNAYDRFRERIMFPIRDRRGRVIGFGGRVLGDGTPKYLNSPETAIFHKGRELYGLFQARQANRELESVLVVEGYMDVVVLAQYEISNAVATLGTAITEHHINELVRHTDEIVFCFDGDRAGKQAAWRALETALAVMDGKAQFKFMFLPQGQDPDSMVQQIGAEGFQNNIRQAIPLSEFFLESLLKKADIRKLDGKARLIQLAKPFILKINDIGYRGLLLDRLSDITETPSAQLLKLFGIGGSSRLAPRRSPATFSRGQREVSSLARKAISLLLHKPQLSAAVDDVEKVAGIQVPGSLLLYELLVFLQANPHVNTAGLLERWRDQPESVQLNTLAMDEIHLSEQGLEQEFQDALKQLHQFGKEVELDHLLKKSQYAELTSEEKERLRNLLVVKSPTLEA